MPFGSLLGIKNEETLFFSTKTPSLEIYNRIIESKAWGPIEKNKRFLPEHVISYVDDMKSCYNKPVIDRNKIIIAMFAWGSYRRRNNGVYPCVIMMENPNTIKVILNFSNLIAERALGLKRRTSRWYEFDSKQNYHTYELKDNESVFSINTIVSHIIEYITEHFYSLIFDNLNTNINSQLNTDLIHTYSEMKKYRQRLYFSLQLTVTPKEYAKMDLSNLNAIYISKELALVIRNALIEAKGELHDAILLAHKFKSTQFSELGNYEKYKQEAATNYGPLLDYLLTRELISYKPVPSSKEVAKYLEKNPVIEPESSIWVKYDHGNSFIDFPNLT